MEVILIFTLVLINTFLYWKCPLPISTFKLIILIILTPILIGIGVGLGLKFLDYISLLDNPKAYSKWLLYLFLLSYSLFIVFEVMGYSMRIAAKFFFGKEGVSEVKTSDFERFYTIFFKGFAIMLLAIISIIQIVIVTSDLEI